MFSNSVQSAMHPSHTCERKCPSSPTAQSCTRSLVARARPPPRVHSKGIRLPPANRPSRALCAA
eukprot:6176336-Pleurochrysis_carterae.AAC.2